MSGICGPEHQRLAMKREIILVCPRCEAIMVPQGGQWQCHQCMAVHKDNITFAKGRLFDMIVLPKDGIKKTGPIRRFINWLRKPRGD